MAGREAPESGEREGGECAFFSSTLFLRTSCPFVALLLAASN